MIPSDPKELERMRELAARNIANGDWGDEVTLPGEATPRSPEELKDDNVVSDVLSKVGSRRPPRKQ